jgi:four helix bundle protein
MCWLHLVDWPAQLRERTKKFALATIRFCRTLPHTVEGDVFRRQLLKSGTSVGANYRGTCRGRSKAEKRAKLGVVIEESDESEYWLELLETAALGNPEQRTWLLKEAGELTALFVSCRRGMD